MPTAELPRFDARRYLQPLREGGSLPAVVDTGADGLFVVKFRGAGQGPKALIAELIVGMLAAEVGLPTPELALIDVEPAFGRTEPDPEIQEILKKSHGVNVGLRYLDGAFNFDPSAGREFVSRDLATRLVWFDAYVTNPDRTHRNPNLLLWKREPWLIDHGAALYAHHDWRSVDEARARGSFPLIKSHVLLEESGDLVAADAAMKRAITPAVIDSVLSRVPDALLLDSVNGGEFQSGDDARARYRDYLTTRLAASETFTAAAIEARDALGREPRRRLQARR
ncbi:MAG: aminotransferase class I and II [Gemmatimonadaceae bacterium]|nr:aminotransferase class I and II [Gemmatimonadaceae bacterium]NUQ92447.1 aminotransferase class I and II [Gemmatimonadaceae bacterium]NUS95790.1 aminotransferase class I and II [Gemmatimonadaceae bacterium]